jgi:hypothetical protein
VDTATLRLSDEPSVKVPVKCGDLHLFALMDAEDAERPGERKLSLGSHGYAQMYELAGDGSEGKTTILVHRWVMGARRRDGRIVDHINGVRLDCRKVNLRFVTAAESSANVKARAVSGFRGVYPMKGKWQAKGKRAGQVHHLGTYATPEEAAKVAHLWRLENLPGLHGP